MVFNIRTSASFLGDSIDHPLLDFIELAYKDLIPEQGARAIMEMIAKHMGWTDMQGRSAGFITAYVLGWEWNTRGALVKEIARLIATQEANGTFERCSAPAYAGLWQAAWLQADALSLNDSVRRDHPGLREDAASELNALRQPDTEKKAASILSEWPGAMELMASWLFQKREDGNHGSETYGRVSQLLFTSVENWAALPRRNLPEPVKGLQALSVNAVTRAARSAILDNGNDPDEVLAEALKGTRGQDHSELGLSSQARLTWLALNLK